MVDSGDGILFLGAGPANLACALRLVQEAAVEASKIRIVERSKDAARQAPAAALLDPRSLRELLGPDFAKALPNALPLLREEHRFLTETGRFRFPWMPRALRNSDSLIVDGAELLQALSAPLEQAGVAIETGRAARRALLDGERVCGLEMEDGSQIEASVTVLGDGARGPVSRDLIDRLGLDGSNPQIFAASVHELWELNDDRLQPGSATHYAGWPLGNEDWGGGYLLTLSERKAALGFVLSSDASDPDLDPRGALRAFRAHPDLAPQLEGATQLQSALRLIPEGGYWSRPRSSGAGFLILGDAASLFDVARNKGLHLAMKSGTLAAEAIREAVMAKDFSASALSLYPRLAAGSWIESDLRRSRNYRPALRYGFWLGSAIGQLGHRVGGRIVRDRVPYSSLGATPRIERWISA